MAQQDKPGKVALNLDTLQREGEEQDPYVVALAGKPYSLLDPRSLPFEVVLTMEDSPVAFISAAIGDDQRDDFIPLVKKLPAWKVNQMVVGYRRYFGLLSSPEAGASRTS